MKVFEIIIILIFTLFSLIIIYQYFFENKLEIKEKEIVISSKENYLSKIMDLIVSCFNENKKENKIIVCYKINYLGKNEIEKKEIEKTISNLNIYVEINFETINTNEKTIIVYSIDKIVLKKAKEIIG
ncbi:MAG: hypothetical protein QW367_00820 [Candidatus Aenigmatarchaeota archaeon]